MISDKFGPTFASELVDAGVAGLAFSINRKGDINFSDSITPEQHRIILNVVNNHDPNKKLPELSAEEKLNNFLGVNPEISTLIQNQQSVIDQLIERIEALEKK
jgi:hypothetical protein